MKILLITPNDLNENSGGGLCAKSLYLGCKMLNNVEVYVYSPNKLNETHIVAYKSKKVDILSRITFHSNYLYVDWKKNKQKVYELKPDIIFLTNSRLGFVIKDIKKNLPFCKVITHVDNIEYDYCKNYMERYRGVKKKLLYNVEKRCIKNDEQKTFKYSDHIIFLTKRDQLRANELYNSNIDNTILPICLSSKCNNFNKNNNNINLVFLASLWYKPNNDGIVWFIKNVWSELYSKNSESSLIIGGKNPSQELLSFNNQNNIKVYANFSEADSIVPKNSIFISPIFEGAGMKVKVAETLSMGFPIIATNESLVGYEEAISDESNISIYRANTKDEFLKILRIINNQDFEYITRNAFELFNKYYSIQRAYRCMKDIVDIII